MLLLVSLLLAQDPVIESARTLTGGAARAGCWLPLEVTARAAERFEGTLAVVAAPITIAQPILLEAGERKSVAIPTLPLYVHQPIEIQLRAGPLVRARRPLDEPIELLRDQDLLVATRPARTVPGVRTFELTPPWRDFDFALFESIDAILSEEDEWPAGLPRAVPASPRPRFGVVEPLSAAFQPADRWIESKRNAAILFVVLYAFSFVNALAWASTRKVGAASVMVTVCGLAAAATVVFFSLFPRGRTAVHAWAAVIDQTEYRLHVLRGGPVTHARIAKPIAATRQAVENVEIVLDRGCRVSGAAATLTQEPRRPIVGTIPAAENTPRLRFFVDRLGPARVSQVAEAAHAAPGITAPDLVESRLEPRWIVERAQ